MKKREEVDLFAFNLVDLIEKHKGILNPPDYYLDMNIVADKILKNKDFLKELNEGKFKEDPVVQEAAALIVTAGYVTYEHRDEIMSVYHHISPPLRKIDLKGFLKINPNARLYISPVEKGAVKTFRRPYDFGSPQRFNESKDVLLKRENLEGQRNLREMNRLVKSIKRDSLYSEVPDLKSNVKRKTPGFNMGQELQEEKLVIGPLIYKNSSIYCNDSYVDFAPQAVKICRTLMMASAKNDTFVSDSKLKESLGQGDYMPTENLQKIVSKIRRSIKTKLKKFEVIRKGERDIFF